MTLIGGPPNGSGKSTWCAFLRTMLYGLDTRQRDRKGRPLPTKTVTGPGAAPPWRGCWSVNSRAGSWSSAGPPPAVPMGDFSAVYQDTGLAVPGLTGETAGEILTGVSQEVFDRSVFFRQTGLAVSQSQELEKRITALVSSGEEDVSWTEANERLKTWLHRRRFHKSGLIPQLEAEEAQLQQTLTQTASLRQDLAQLQARAAGLRQQKAHWESRLSMENDKFQTISQRRYAEAAAELDAAELQLQTLLARQQADAPQTEPDPDELEEEIQDTLDDLASRRRLMTGFVTLIVLLTLCGGGAVRSAPCAPVPPAPGDSPPVSGPCGGGVLWLLVLLFTLIKSACDRRDTKALDELRALLETRQQEDSHLAQDLREAQTAGSTPKNTSRLSASRAAAAPYLPGGGGLPGLPAPGRAGDRPDPRSAHRPGGPGPGGCPAGRDSGGLRPAAGGLRRH